MGVGVGVVVLCWGVGVAVMRRGGVAVWRRGGVAVRRRRRGVARLYSDLVQHHWTTRCLPSRCARARQASNRIVNL